MKNFISLIFYFMIFFGLYSCYLPSDIDEPYAISPLNKNLSTSRKLTLNWNVQNSRVKYYDLFLAESKEKLKNSNPIASKIKNHFFINEIPLKAETDYYWRVLASYGNGKFSKSKVWHFKTSNNKKKDPTYFLITIGITDYDNVNDLTYTKNDSQDFYRVFKRLNEPWIVSIKEEYATQTDFENMINSVMPNSQMEDVLLFHYAGHGVFLENQSMLVYSDSPKYDSNNYNAFINHNLTTTKLKTILDPFPGEKYIVIDACQSGGFRVIGGVEPQSTNTSLNDFDMAKEFKLEIEKNISLLSNQKLENRYHIISATRKDQLGFENKLIENGIFSFSFLNGIGDDGHLAQKNIGFNFSYNADTVCNKKITVKELFNWSARETKRLFINLSMTDSTLLKNPIQQVTQYSYNPDIIFTEYFK